METSNSFSTAIVVLFCMLYIVIFILSTVGNTWVLVTCYKTLRQRNSPFLWLLANLASADLFFTFLTLLNGIAFLWRWVGGNATCKLQGFFLEASYTTTIMTLAIISYERLKATTDPFNSRVGRWPHRQYIKLIVIWSCSLLVCSPLLSVYHVETRQNVVVCLANAGNIAPKIYYSIHSTVFFAAPLLYMIFTQSRTFRALSGARIAPMMSTALSVSRSNQRQRKVAKTLAALTVAFLICWSPFMVTRTLMYFRVMSPGFAWKVSQLLIFLNTGLDPLLYGYYGGNLKTFFQRRPFFLERATQPQS